MANPGYMTITGKVQGLISAGCSTKESVGNKYQSGHTDEIMVLACTHNMANIENRNKSTHGPILITKYIDKSSALLAQALANREEINFTIDFYRVSSFGGGVQEKFYSISIKGGIIADLSFDMPHVILQSDSEMQEQIAIRYREIIWTHHTAGTSGYRFWDEQV